MHRQLLVLLVVAMAACGSGPAAVTTTPSATAADPTRLGNLPSRDRVEWDIEPPVQAPAQPAATVATKASYTTVFELRIPAVGIDMPVIDVGVVKGAMDAPGVANANDPIWKTAFWLNEGAVPGYHGTATIAGHVTDSWARPAGFWPLKKVQPGVVVEIVRKSDAATVRYRVTEVDDYPLAQANSPAVLARLYGPPGGGVDDGVARLSLITCTGKFVGNGYDRRLIAFAELIIG